MYIENIEYEGQQIEIDIHDIEGSVKPFLQYIDKPFIYNLWQACDDTRRNVEKQSGKLKKYLNQLKLCAYKDFTYKDSLTPSLQKIDSLWPNTKLAEIPTATEKPVRMIIENSKTKEYGFDSLCLRYEKARDSQMRFEIEQARREKNYKKEEQTVSMAQRDKMRFFEILREMLDIE